MLATNAYPPLLRRLRLMTVPVYDYALMTEPLTDAQRAAIGWEGREGISDTGNQFHYFRTTRDGRILWGGYDAIYHFASGISRTYDERPETFEVLARNFFATFPQLAGLRFTHAWGGVIDTCTPLRRVLRHGDGGRVGLRPGLHRPRRRRHPVRRRGRPRPARRPGHPADPARDGPQEAGAVPARAVALGRDRGHPPVAGAGRRQRGPGEPLAQDVGPAGARLRLLASAPRVDCSGLAAVSRRAETDGGNGRPTEVGPWTRKLRARWVTRAPRTATARLRDAVEQSMASREILLTLGRVDADPDTILDAIVERRGRRVIARARDDRQRSGEAEPGEPVRIRASPPRGEHEHAEAERRDEQGAATAVRQAHATGVHDDACCEAQGHRPGDPVVADECERERYAEQRERQGRDRIVGVARLSALNPHPEIAAQEQGQEPHGRETDAVGDDT